MCEQCHWVRPPDEAEAVIMQLCESCIEKNKRLMEQQTLYDDDDDLTDDESEEYYDTTRAVVNNINAFESGERPNFNLSIPEPNECVHPQESKMFDGEQLPLKPEEYEAAVKKAKADIDEACRQTMEDLKDAKTTEQLRELLNIFLDNWRAQLINEGPAKFKAVQTPLVEGGENASFNHKTRSYTREQMDFLSELCQRYLNAGMIIRCETQKTSSPVLVVKKPNGKGFRMTIDLRTANLLVQTLVAPAVHLDMVRSCLAGAKYFATMDLSDGYWQIQLDELGSALYSFRTHEGSFKMLRLPQGAKNSSAIFQECMNEACGDLLYGKGNGAIPYQDDILCYGRSKQELLDVLRKIFERFKKYNLKVKLQKSKFFTKSVPWIGMTFGADGVGQPESRVKAILNLSTPENAQDLTSFIGAVNWMQKWLGYQYHDRMRHFLKMKSDASKLVGGSMKGTQLKKVNLRSSGLWTTESDKHWEQCLNMIARETTKLAHPDPEHFDLHVFSDASDLGYGGMITQTPKTQSHLPIEERDHQVLGFNSGDFKGAQLRWSTFSQEAWGLIDTIETFSNFLFSYTQPFHVWTDHKNLVYIFNTDKFTARKQTSDRVQRWSFMLSRYNFILHHIAGETNLMPDILSRWREDHSVMVQHVSPSSYVAMELLNMDVGKSSKQERALKKLQAHNPLSNPIDTGRTRRTRNSAPNYANEIKDGDEYIPTEAAEDVVDMSDLPDDSEPIYEIEDEPAYDDNFENSSQASMESETKYDDSDSESDSPEASIPMVESLQDLFREQLKYSSARTQYNLMSNINFAFHDTNAIIDSQNEYIESAIVGERLDNAVDNYDIREIVLKEVKAEVKELIYFKDVTYNLIIKKDTKMNLWMKEDQIFIPPNATHLQICILTLAHSGISGHCGINPTFDKIKDIYYWPTMKKDVEKFVKECLHCVGTKLGEKIPRPLASTIHGLYPNHVMRADFLRLPHNKKVYPNGYIGVLMLKDDASQFTWLVPVKRETAFVFADALIKWASHSKFPVILSVDKGSHFINQLTDALAENEQILICPTIASNKQTHGGAEAINKIVKRILMNLCSERHLSTFEWHKVLNILVHAINHRQSPTLAGYAPVQLFTGQQPDNMVELHLNKVTGKPLKDYLVKKPLTRDFHHQIQQLQIELNNWQREANEAAEKKRSQSRKSRNKKRMRNETKFEVGDFVLRSIPEESSPGRARTKLQQIWIGPYQVVKSISNKLHICRDLLTGVCYELHVDRMSKYCNDGLTVDGRIQKQLTFDTTSKEAQKIVDLSIANGKPMVKIKWKGVRNSEVWHNLNLATKLFSVQEIITSLEDIGTKASKKIAKQFSEKMR